MLTPLKATYEEYKTWGWDKFAPFADELIQRPLSAETIDAWLQDWSQISDIVTDIFSRMNVATSQNTADAGAEADFNHFMDEIFPNALAFEQKLKDKLLASGLAPRGFEIPLRNYRRDAEIFRQENLPLLSEEHKMGLEYDQIIGKQTIQWQGEEVTPTQLRPVYQSEDRALREQAWRLSMSRFLADRQQLNELWVRFFNLRKQIAANAGLPDFRAYVWKMKYREDYTPDNCEEFHRAIEEVVVPAASRIYARRKAQLGVDQLRPWDLNVDPLGLPALKPFENVDELIQKASAIFHHVDADLGGYFDTMVREKLLDLPNRKNKAPGAFCTSYPLSHRPFVFANAVGIHDDVQTTLHECGHAFHVFESAHVPLAQLHEPPMEFNEVASMGMELLASPYLDKAHGGFYAPEDAKRAFHEHLESNILFWPYMAVVDAFQHWAYTHPEAAVIPQECDAAWDGLWARFMPGVDWGGLEAERMTGWHRKLHIFQVPFYYVEYGLAQLGACQIWRNSLQDQQKAVQSYRSALSLAGTVTLPKLYETAGAKFTFKSDILGEVVDLMEQELAK